MFKRVVRINDYVYVNKSSTGLKTTDVVIHKATLIPRFLSFDHILHFSSAICSASKSLSEKRKRRTVAVYIRLGMLQHLLFCVVGSILQATKQSTFSAFSKDHILLADFGDNQTEVEARMTRKDGSGLRLEQ
eukprot:5838582-Pleurochrysis_carterae.AAC.2